MKYINIPCTACGKTFEETDDVVVCPECGAPHHRACWTQDGRCAKDDAHAKGFVWRAPEPEKPPALPEEPAPERGNTGNADHEEIRFRNGESVVPCPQCGAANYQNDIYCLRCGAKLDGTGDPYRDNGERRAASDPYFADYRYHFDRYGGISPDAPVDGIPCAEYSDFVGGSKPGRIIRKVSTMERYDKRFSWSWAALFLGPIWFFWRKLKKEGAVFAAVLLFLSVLFGLLQVNSAYVAYVKEIYAAYGKLASQEIDLAEFQEQLTAISDEYENGDTALYSDERWLALKCTQYLRTLALPLISALLAIPLYRKHARKRILEIRMRCSSMEEYGAALMREGGTSAGGAVLGVIAVLLSFFFLNYLPALIAMAV